MLNPLREVTFIKLCPSKVETSIHDIFGLFGLWSLRTEQETSLDFLVLGVVFVVGWLWFTFRSGPWPCLVRWCSTFLFGTLFITAFVWLLSWSVCWPRASDFNFIFYSKITISMLLITSPTLFKLRILKWQKWIVLFLIIMLVLHMPTLKC